MSIDNGLSNLTLYDAKKYFRKAQNVVFNYTEMEAKVREATNNEPWGASSTLMEQIAQGTYNYREREEILGMIFRRFTEKTASEWRQIYKALQLLDYLIRHGAERFIDDTRANLSLIKMLESFHYIDSQGRDQGINVRNRAHELALLLDDDAKVRAERKKARETAKKYKGVAGGAPSSYLPASAINTTAGFGRSTRHGLSVSADYDSDAEENTDAVNGNSEHASISRPDFKDQSPLANGDAGENDGDDDDDDFADFQSAAPVISSEHKTTASALTDLYAAQPSQLVNAAPNALGSTQLPVATAPVPAISTSAKKTDPFDTLFASAKTTTTSAPTSPSVNLSGPTSEADAKDNTEDEDGFGEMTQAAPTNESTSNPQEVDLLSF